jgi:hypothetical protein
MSIVEDRRHVYVPSHSVKFDSSWGLMHPLMLTTFEFRKYHLVVVEVSGCETYIYANWLTRLANIHYDHATRDAGLYLRRFYFVSGFKNPNPN